MKPIDKFEQLARKVKFEPDAATDQRILSAAEAALDRRAAMPDATRKRKVWQAITKTSVIKLAAAAVVTVAVALILNAFLCTSHVVWASVPDRVNDQDSFRYRSISHKVEIDANGTSHSREVETIACVSKDHGMVVETSVDGKPFGKYYELFDSREHVSIYYGTRQYWKSQKRKQETWEDFAETGDPRRLVAKALEGQYTRLGRKMIDGRVVEGVESCDPNILSIGRVGIVLRLWIDVKAQLPVRTETMLGPYENSGVTIMETAVADQFHWAIEFPPDFFLFPQVPEGFRVMTLKPDETAFVNAVRAWAKSNGGAYPSSLDDSLSVWGMENSKRAMDVIQVRQLPTGEYREDRIMDARRFYEMLVQDGNSPVYYGDHVSPADSNAILMYWHLSGAAYRVVWGDLRLQTMQAGDMVHYLRGLGGGDTWASGMVRGHLIYPYRRPEDRAVVWIGLQRIPTESSGDFAIAAPPVDSNETWLAYAFGPEDTQTGRAFPLRASDRDKDLTIVLEPLCTVKGRIIDSAGQPRQSAAMWLVGHADDKKETLSMLHYPPTLAPDGSLEIRGVPSGAALDLVAMVSSGGRTRVAVGELAPGQTLDLGVIVLDDTKQDNQ